MVSFVKVNNVVLFDVLFDAFKVFSNLDGAGLFLLKHENEILLNKKGGEIKELLQVWRLHNLQILDFQTSK